VLLKNRDAKMHLCLKGIFWSVKKGLTHTFTHTATQNSLEQRETKGYSGPTALSTDSVIHNH